MKYYQENTETKQNDVNKIIDFAKQNQRWIAIVVAAILTLFAVTYTYNRLTIGDPTTGCTSYSCINHKQWVPIPGGKTCLTC